MILNLLFAGIFSLSSLLGCTEQAVLDITYFRYTDNFHVKFGRISNLSTRKGKAVFLEDILNEAKERMIKTIQNKESMYGLKLESLKCFID